ncbi:unnamed protein product [Soboliphyme baturini]|uniref:RNA 3'-terminal-phosphate cyclase (ATP) n=1 Tax=Soboliphyme baturini TaxID=241478 RepID=A0A183IH72_9BILA|nr:unnamed protein product [Soboliphyme baturini]
MAEKFGFNFECEVRRRGYYPRGGGEVQMTTNPVKSLHGVEMLDRGNISHIAGFAWCAGTLPVKFKVARAMADGARSVLHQRLGHLPIEINSVLVPSTISVGTATGIVLKANSENGCILGSDLMGKKGNILYLDPDE